jgi:hypothetical protein
MKALTIKELVKKRDYHDKRAQYYDEKIKKAESKKSRIGFKHYD